MCPLLLIVVVQHGQALRTNVAFAPSLSFLCIFCVLVLALSGVRRCLCTVLKVLIVCFQSRDCALGSAPSSSHVSIVSPKRWPDLTGRLVLREAINVSQILSADVPSA